MEVEKPEGGDIVKSVISNNQDTGGLQGVPVYKCDFCDEKCGTSSGMITHLNKFGHFSASKVDLVKGKGDYKILEKLAVMVKSNLYKTMVAVCPNPVCNEMFKTTYSCALHHRLQHNDCGKLVYGLAEVLEKKEFTNPFFSCKCPVCGETSLKHATAHKGRPKKHSNKRNVWNNWLIQHYRQKNHYPFDFNAGDCRFLCTECDKGFDDSLFRAQCHEVNHQKLPYSRDMKLRVIQTGKVRELDLPEIDLTPSVSLKEIRWNETKDVRAKCTADENIDGSVGVEDDNDGESDSDVGIEMDDQDKERNPNRSNDREQCQLISSNNNQGTTSMEADDATTRTTSSMNTDKPRLESNLDLAGEYMFLCDYCDKIDKNRDVIYQHLLNDFHSSASIVQVDIDGKPLILFEQRSVQNYRAAYKKSVAACPIEGCHMLFPDIYQCSMHCKVFHECSENIYGISEIKDCSELQFSADLTCNICKVTYTSGFKFKAHLDEANHHWQGYDILSPPENMDIHFVCLYCEMVIDTYFTAVNHVRNNHHFKSIHHLYRIKVIQTDKVVRKLYMLPFSSHLNAHSNLELISKLKKSGGKEHRRKFQKEKANLNNKQPSKKKKKGPFVA